MFLTTIVCAVLLAPTAAQYTAGQLFDDVARVLARDFHDAAFRRDELPRLASRYRERARASLTQLEEREVIHSFLGEVPASHLALLSNETHEHLWAELDRRREPTVGFQLTEIGGRYFVDWVFEGGPAARSGLERGDEVVSIDGLSTQLSPRLDWRSDDAALPDPAVHQLLCSERDELSLEVRRTPHSRARVTVRAEPYSSFDATRASVRVTNVDGWSVGYVHFWYIHNDGAVAFLEDLIAGEFAGCHGLLLDLRGRGGSAAEARRLVRVLRRDEGRWGRPLVLLTDDGTRSAKEVIAWELRDRRAALIVGERTSGAVIPATFHEVGRDAVLMYPSTKLGRYTELLEGRGVAPDVEVEDELPYAQGADPILHAGRIALTVWCEEFWESE